MKNITRVLCFILIALMIFAVGCDTAVETTSETEQTEPLTEPETEEETEPEETEEVITYKKVSDKLEMPEVKSVTTVEFITANLNTILKNGYGTKSLMADAFDKVFDRIILFKTGKDGYSAYVLGQRRELATYGVTLESGHYLDLFDVSEVFGGDYSYEVNDGTPKTTFKMGDNVAVCEGETAKITVNGETYDAEVKVSSRIIDDSDNYTDVHFVNVKDLSKLTGLNVYYTDSGIICFSAGQAFDSLRGYYVLEEAAKLFLEDDKKEEFKNNMFVDIPNIIKLTDNNVAAYSYP